MNILVLAGGLSPERNVSRYSGTLIGAALRRRGHRAVVVDVYEGIDVPAENPLSVFDQIGVCVPEVGGVPDLEAVRASMNGQQESIGKNVLMLCKMADVVFLALHGAMGENGQLQATLDSFGIRRYTGSGYVGSALAMDKDLSKKIVSLVGVRTPSWMHLDGKEADVEEILRQIGLPCVVKPRNGGSSVGVSIAETREELVHALDCAREVEASVLIEQKITGRELTCGILNGSVLPPVEILPKSGFYDYRNKYVAGATTEICPAPIGEEKTAELAAITEKAFAALRLEGYGRLDYILDEEGALWFLEANTLPGMTTTSLLPQEAAAEGISYDELCEQIVMQAYRK